MALGAGMMATTLLGTGVFILPQLTVEMSGSNAIYAWLLLTIGLLPIIHIFGKLSSIHPHSRTIYILSHILWSFMEIAKSTLNLLVFGIV